MPDLVVTVVVCIVGTLFLGSIVGMGVTSWQYNKKINECWLCEWEYVTVYTISRTNNNNPDTVRVTYGYGTNNDGWDLNQTFEVTPQEIAGWPTEFNTLVYNTEKGGLTHGMYPEYINNTAIRIYDNKRLFTLINWIFIFTFIAVCLIIHCCIAIFAPAVLNSMDCDETTESEEGCLGIFFAFVFSIWFMVSAIKASNMTRDITPASINPLSIYNMDQCTIQSPVPASKIIPSSTPLSYTAYNVELESEGTDSFFNTYIGITERNNLAPNSVNTCYVNKYTKQIIIEDSVPYTDWLADPYPKGTFKKQRNNSIIYFSIVMALIVLLICLFVGIFVCVS